MHDAFVSGSDALDDEPTLLISLCREMPSFLAKPAYRTWGPQHSDERRIDDGLDPAASISFSRSRFCLLSLPLHLRFVLISPL